DTEFDLTSSAAAAVVPAPEPEPPLAWEPLGPSEPAPAPVPIFPPPAPARPTPAAYAAPPAFTGPLISGAHTILFGTDTDALRAFFRDTLGLPSVDSGGGWLIFALPPSEVAVHPADAPGQAFYLLCDDLDATLAELARRGFDAHSPVREERWGRVTELALPGG